MATTRAQTRTTINAAVHQPFLDHGLRVEIITITPDMATKWLRHNHVNRAIKRRHIARLCTELRAGSFDGLNGATISFSEHQDLMDGQHRLSAIIETQIPITTLVVFGVKEATRGTIDTGSSRNFGDYLAMRSHPNARNLAAALGFYKAWQLGKMENMHRQQTVFVGFDDGLAFLAQHPGVADSVGRTRYLPKLLRPSHAAALDYAFAHKDAPLREAWFETMRTGREHQVDVFLTLRERLIRDKTGGIQRHHLEPFVYTLKAWNAARSGKTIKVFKWHETEEIPAVK